MITVNVSGAKNRRRNRMRPRMWPAAIQYHPRLPLSRKCRVARDLHISPAAADKLLYGPKAANRLYTAIIASDVRAGDLDAIACWIAPAEGALAPLPAATPDHALQLFELSVAWWAALHAEHLRGSIAAYTDLQVDQALRALARVHLAVTRTMAALELMRSERGSR